jgi:hypothetical protein
MHWICTLQVQVAGALGAQAPPAGMGFRSRSSAELLAGLSVGSAAGQRSPRLPLVHSMTPYGPVRGQSAAAGFRGFRLRFNNP